MRISTMLQCIRPPKTLCAATRNGLLPASEPMNDDLYCFLICFEASSDSEWDRSPAHNSACFGHGDDVIVQPAARLPY